ncbi:MAG: complex I NDUFA9 subunit family protein [Novosphingobium sp.]|nr:complex I NDUFA9 subunit family protein [Novosphingobium sp.]
MTGTRRDTRLRDKLIVLIGGSGFFGRHLAQELLWRGARVRLVSRRPERAFDLRPLAAIGQIQFLAGDVTRPAALAPLLTGADGVVNLVGAFSGDLDALQGRGIGRLAAAAKAAEVGAFVHVSANAADAESPSDYARTKAEGEQAVRAAFPEATILRPAILFGPDDAFLNRFARLIAWLPVLPVFGPEAKLQPVFVDDAADAAAAALCDPTAHGGRSYELNGPEVLSMLELNRAIAAAQGRRRGFIPLPDGLSGAIAALPLAPITRDQWLLLKRGDVASGMLPGLKDMGITPRPLSLFLDRWMVPYRKYGRFSDRVTLSGAPLRD